jgi:undecaprenyl phosphate-alpha-L-ara4FN deformylase
MRAAADAGHEIGLHAWDHHGWQTKAGDMSVAALRADVARGVDALEQATGRVPGCSAAAGWICNERVLEAKEQVGFTYNSDCRGLSAFRPRHARRNFTLQVPTTMPTYDEVIGRDGIDNNNYNERLLAHVRRGALNVLAVHAEVEGIVCAGLFDDFLYRCRDAELETVPLRKIVNAGVAVQDDWIAHAPVPGREGPVCWQRSALDA